MTSNGFEHSDRAAARSRFLAWNAPFFCAVLAVAIIFCFWDVLLGIRTFVFRDYGLFGYPLAAYNRELFWRGELPLWNPLTNCGLPYLAQWNTMTLYPLGIFYLVLPLTWALPVFCIGHLFLGGVGMFVLGRRWCGDATAAAVAGAAYAFNGLTLNSLMWPNNIAALGWLPWVMWALEAAVQERGKKILIAALIGATQMLAGAPEIIIFTWALAGIFALLPVISRRDWRGLPTAFLTLGIVVALTAALAAAQLLPFLNLLQESHRSAGVVGYESPMPPWGWANFLVPLFHTYKSHSGVYFQAGQVWTSSYYISVVAIYLGLFGAFSRRPRTWLLLGGAAFCLIMALGNSGYLYSWLRERFPQVAIMNFPIKFVVPIIFAVPALAAYGMSRFREDMVKRDAVLVASGILAGIAALAWWSYAHPMEPGE